MLNQLQIVMLQENSINDNYPPTNLKNLKETLETLNDCLWKAWTFALHNQMAAEINLLKHNNTIDYNLRCTKQKTPHSFMQLVLNA